jgi:hypothetical protein
MLDGQDHVQAAPRQKWALSQEAFDNSTLNAARPLLVLSTFLGPFHKSRENGAESVCLPALIRVT